MSAAGISVGSIKSPLVPVTSITEDGKFCVDPRAEGQTSVLKSLPRPRIILPVTAFGIQSEFFSNPQDVVFLRDENISIL